MSHLPVALYTRQSVAAFDRLTIASGVAGYTLMRRAGASVFAALRQRFDVTSRLLVLCGSGNNAGDGYVVARLAKQAGWSVRVVSLIEPERLKGDAATACAHWRDLGSIESFSDDCLQQADVVVDALLGTGLTRAVDGSWREAIVAVNGAALPVVAVDIPSGLDADSGTIQGVAIEAAFTVTFIGLKQGLFTASGRQCCGEVLFDDLGVPPAVLQQRVPSAWLLDSGVLSQLPSRRQDAHKGSFGHVLIIGGNHGMAGAVALTARAALRTGAGRVSVVTRSEHVGIVTSLCPEAMVHACLNGQMDEGLLAQCTHVLIGPGLGRDAWARRLLYQTARLDRPVLYDADALNLIAEVQTVPDNAAVITPHPGEAARLCACSSADIQAQRFEAVRRCRQFAGAVTVLKGSGTLIDDGGRIYVCDAGTVAMATAGMGDVLAGIIGGLLAQGSDAALAARLGVFVHARAAEMAADGADRGVLASDVIGKLGAIWKTA